MDYNDKKRVVEILIDRDKEWFTHSDISEIAEDYDKNEVGDFIENMCWNDILEVEFGREEEKYRVNEQKKEELMG
jgi:hypothetical protein